MGTDRLRPGRHCFCSTATAVTTLYQSKGYRLIVVAPVYDDAPAASELVRHLQQAFWSSNVDWSVMFVDDGSPVRLAQQLQGPSDVPVEVLRLKRNVGHQRAIALVLDFENNDIDFRIPGTYPAIRCSFQTIQFFLEI